MQKNNRFKACLKEFESAIKADIVKARREEEPLTTTAIAKRTNLTWTWKTAIKRFLGMLDGIEVVLRRIEGGTKLFSLSQELKKGEQTP